MLQKPSSVVLASLKAATHETEYALTSRSLRPCWTGFFIILWGFYFATCGLPRIP